MKSPLRKRIPRELKGEFGKYLVVFLLMVLTIGFVSGFLVADGSMLKAYNDSFDKYNIENGNFRTMPILSDWYEILYQEQDTRHLAVPECSLDALRRGRMIRKNTPPTWRTA